MRNLRPRRLSILVAVTLAVLIGLTGYALSESAASPTAAAGSARPAGAASAPTDQGDLLQSGQILQFLDRTVAWYRSRTAQEQLNSAPGG